MEQDNTAAIADATALTGIELVACHVDDFAKGMEFYGGLLGLEKQFDMAANTCFFKLGENCGLYLEGGNEAPAPGTSGTTRVRASFAFAVRSAGALFAKLQAAGVPIVQKEPMDMQNGQYWFQFSDPAGNILEALGGK